MDGSTLRQPTKKQKIKKKSVLSCQRATKIGTLNVRTIRTEEKREELGHLFEESGLQILAIQEHRIIHDEPIKRDKDWSKESPDHNISHKEHSTSCSWRSRACD